MVPPLSPWGMKGAQPVGFRAMIDRACHGGGVVESLQGQARSNRCPSHSQVLNPSRVNFGRADARSCWGRGA